MKKINKLIILVILSVQNALLVLMMSQHNKVKDLKSIKPSVVVCWVEIVKLILCILLEWFFGDLRRIKKDSISNVLWLAIPAFLYAIQNNLCHLALSYLSPIIYQILYQSKILTTAVFSVLLLNKVLTKQHWTSLSLLTTGIILVQTQNVDHAGYFFHWKGLIALGIAAITSGFSGVFFELLVKKSSYKRSLWIQSIYLCLLCLPMSIIIAFSRGDLDNVIPTNYKEIGLILLQAVSGLLVAIIIRYLDNILKTFATGASILLCILFQSDNNNDISVQLIIGSVLVLLSVYLYGIAENSTTSITRKKKAKIKRIESARL